VRFLDLKFPCKLAAKLGELQIYRTKAAF